MCRTSKFSFPRAPGHANHARNESIPVRSSGTSSVSKAQRILGTEGDLNIDLPNRDEEDNLSWPYDGLASSAMSISISESTKSIYTTTTGNALDEPRLMKCDEESGVFPRTPGHVESSLHLAQQHTYTDTARAGRNSDEQLRRKDSSSTLRFYYDVHDQTTEASQQPLRPLQDLAVTDEQAIVTSPLQGHGHGNNNLVDVRAVKHAQGERHLQHEAPSRIKPALLDLSMLFLSRKRRSSKQSDKTASKSPLSQQSSISNCQSELHEPGRRRLTKAISKNSLHSQNQRLLSHKTSEISDPLPQRRNASSEGASSCNSCGECDICIARTGSVDQVELHHRNGKHVDSIGSQISPLDTAGAIFGISNPAQTYNERQILTRALQNSANVPVELSRVSDKSSSNGIRAGPVQWQLERAVVPKSQWDIRKDSVSSWAAETSRYTNGPAFSRQDVQQSSILSLSDSEGEDLNADDCVLSTQFSNEKALRILNGSARQSTGGTRRGSSQPSEDSVCQREPWKVDNPQSHDARLIPRVSLTPAIYSDNRTSAGPNKANPDQGSRVSGNSQNRGKPGLPKSATWKKNFKESSQPQPQKAALPSNEVEPEDTRFMAVTKQEELLLEALRQKRAHMRKMIIEEHETETQNSPLEEGDHEPDMSFQNSRNVSELQDSASDVDKVWVKLDGASEKLNYTNTTNSSIDLRGLDMDTFNPSPLRPSRLKHSKSEPRTESPISRTHRTTAASKSIPRLSAVGASLGFRDD